jgi:hypothetical protein
MKTLTKTTKAASAITKNSKTIRPITVTATVTIDPDVASKIRDSLAAIKHHQTADEFVNELLADLLTSLSGVFEGMIEADCEPRREEIELELEAIRSR